MKTPLLLTVLAGLASTSLFAQEPPPPPGEGSKGHRPMPPPPSPLLIALDADRDGVISAAELTNASTALRALDANADGQLTRNEFCPPPPRQNAREKSKPKKDSASHRPPPPSPLVGAIDADHDKTISATELATASTSLTTLDKNTDGQLTREEFLPRPPRRIPHGSASKPDDAPAP